MKRYTRWLLLLMLVAALVLAACGGGDDDDEEPTEEPAAAETEEATETEEAVETEEPVEAEETEEAADAEETEEAMEATEEASDESDLVATALASGDFAVLVSAVEAAGLVETLQGPGPFTIFAPTDAAFEAALEALGLTADELLADTETLRTILTYHVVEGAVPAADVVELDGQSVETVQGEEISIAIDDEGNVVLNDTATVVLTDVAASNGLIHVIDAVLLPPSMTEAPMDAEMTEEAAMEATEEPVEVAMAEATEEPMDAEMTEEAPMEAEATEEAMMDAEATEEAMMEATEEPMEAEATEEAAMEATEEPAMEATEEPMEEVELPTVGEIIRDSPDHVTLYRVATGLGTDITDVLNGEAPITVFAPTDAAFDAALEALGLNIATLFMDTELATTLLTYHVVEGAVMAADVAGLDGESVVTVQGEEISIAVDDEGNVVLNDTVNVTVTDLMASNGVVHVVDAVLVPPTVMEAVAAAAEAEMMEAEATEEPMEAEATEEAMMEAEATEEAMMEAEATEEAMMEAEATEEAGEMAMMDTTGSIISACLVTDQGGVNDGTFNQLAADALRSAAEDFGLEISIIESATPSDFEPNINTCLDSDAGAVITVGFLLADATAAAAEANPDVYFIGVDQFHENGLTNLVGMQSREDQGGFIVGALAASLSESGVIGGVYGLEAVPAVVKFRNGFEQGACYINPEIQAQGAYTDSFVDPAQGQQVAEALVGQEADVIFGAGGATGSGGISWAAEQGVFVIGVDQDEYFTTFGGGESPGSEFLVTSSLKSIDVGVYNLLNALTLGDEQWLGGGTYILNAENGGISIAPTHDADIPAEALAAANDVLAMLASGELDTGIDPLTGELITATCPE